MEVARLGWVAAPAARSRVMTAESRSPEEGDSQPTAALPSPLLSVSCRPNSINLDCDIKTHQTGK